MRLPQNLSQEVLNLLLEDFDSLCNRFHQVLKTKTENRFNLSTAQLNSQQEDNKDEVFISQILTLPEEFYKLLHFQS